MNKANKLDLSKWLTKAETAAILGISERTLDRLGEQGKGPERRLRPRPGKKPEPVYRPEDVQAMAAAQNKPMIIAPDSPLRTAPAAGSIAPRPPAQPPLGVAEFFALVDGIAQKVTAVLPRAEKLWLTLEEAAQVSGLSEAFLRRLVRTGNLPAVRDRAWKVRRSDLANIAPHAALAKSAGAGKR